MPPESAPRSFLAKGVSGDQSSPGFRGGSVAGDLGVQPFETKNRLGTGPVNESQATWAYSPLKQLWFDQYVVYASQATWAYSPLKHISDKPQGKPQSQATWAYSPLKLLLGSPEHLHGASQATWAYSPLKRINDARYYIH